MASGSSPRLWGTHRLRNSIQWRLRFIPTPVGNTGEIFPAGGDSPVHPHACGEHICSPVSASRTRGSSPRLWGTQFAFVAAIVCRRFIPTPVGNTKLAQALYDCQPVHPHACGEHCRRQDKIDSDIGSSPRLWGTHEGLVAKIAGRRFIPTPVGNTEPFGYSRTDISVHPHACGEHERIPKSIDSASGSSPRLWGTHMIAECHPMPRRFIPTPVGNTSDAV